MKNGLEPKRLSEICRISSALVDPRRDDYQDLLHVGGANIEPSTGRLFDLQTAKDEALVSGKFLFDERMVLYSKIRPYLMKVARPDFKGLCSADIYPLLPIDGQIDRGFLYYMLLTEEFTAFAIAGSERAGMPKVNRDHLFAYTQVIPSVPAQQRIVGILDVAFDAIATAKANAEKNLQNARALFNSYLYSVLSKPQKGWVEKTLEESVDRNCTLSYGIVQPGDEYAGGLPIVRPTDLTTKVIQPSGLKRINPKLARGYQRTALLGGELLLCVRGSTGVLSIASTELNGANVTRGIVPIRFNGALLKPDFAFYLMSSGPVQSQIRERTYGAALMQINIRDLRNIALRFPSLKDQVEITSKLDDLHENTERLESIYQQRLAALEALKKSLLHQAFSGQL
jgi:type I restriction enzyme S subunit